MNDATFTYMVMNIRSTKKGGVIVTTACRGVIKGIYDLYFPTALEASGFCDGDMVNIIEQPLVRLGVGTLFMLEKLEF